MYAEGIVTVFNQEEAIHWYKAACEQGHNLAEEKCKELNIK